MVSEACLIAVHLRALYTMRTRCVCLGHDDLVQYSMLQIQVVRLKVPSRSSFRSKNNSSDRSV